MFESIKKLLLGNGLAQAIQFCSIFFLSRIYSPDEFGLLGQVQSIATVSAIFATLQLHFIIPLSANDDQAKTAVEVIQMISLIFFIFFLTGALLFDSKYIFSAFLMLLLGLGNNYISYLVYKGKFGLLSKFYIFRAFLMISFQTLMGLFSVRNGLVWGALLAEAVTVLSLRWSVIGPILTNQKINLSIVWKTISSWSSFSLYGTVQEVVSVMAFYIPIFLFAYKYGDNVSGQYAMANRLVWAPVILLSGSVAQVLYHRLAADSGQKKMFNFSSFYSLWITVGLLAGTALSFLLKDVYLIVLGENWNLASVMIPLNVLWGCIFLLSTPFRVACRVFQIQKYQLIVDLVTVICISILFFVCDIPPQYMMFGIVLIAVVQNIALSMIVLSIHNFKYSRT